MIPQPCLRIHILQVNDPGPAASPCCPPPFPSPSLPWRFPAVRFLGFAVFSWFRGGFPFHPLKVKLSSRGSEDEDVSQYWSPSDWSCFGFAPSSATKVFFRLSDTLWRSDRSSGTHRARLTKTTAVKQNSTSWCRRQASPAKGEKGERDKKPRIPTDLGIDSPFFSTIVLFKNQLFLQGFGWFCGKKDSWKEWGRYS